MKLMSYEYIHIFIQTSSPARKSKLSESLLTRKLLKVILSPSMHNEQPIVRRPETIQKPHLSFDRFLRGLRSDRHASLREILRSSADHRLRRRIA